MSEYAKTDDENATAQAAPAPGEPRRRAFAMPEGWLGILLLMLVAAALGGLIAVYWPWAGTISEERVAALENRVSQIAAGHGGTAAAGVFADLKRNLGTLTERLDADEARLTALEKTQPAQPPNAQAPGVAAPPATTAGAPLQTQLDQTAAAIASLSSRIQRLETSGATPAQLADAVSKFASLQARVSQLDAAIARAAETEKGTLDAINARLAKLEGNIPDNLKGELAALAPRSDVVAAQARIARLEQANTGDTLHRAAQVLALADLAAAADAGRPFAVELHALAAAEPDDPALRALAPYAQTGVPTLVALRARFPKAAHDALDAVRVESAGGTFERLWVNLLNLVSIRRVGEVAGNDAEARLARAQVDLDRGDLSAAAAEVAAVGPPSSVVLAPWLRDAQARAALDRAVAEADARVVHALAATRAMPAASPGPVAPPADVAPAAPAAEPVPTPRQKP